MSQSSTPFHVNIQAQHGRGYKSIRNVSWTDIPAFAILTGKNGSGKTQLLELLSYHLTKSSPPGFQMFPLITISGTNYDPGDVAYIPSVGRFSDGPAISLTSMAQQRQNLLSLAMMSINFQPFFDPQQAAMSKKALSYFKGQNPQQIPPEQIDQYLKDDFDWVLNDLNVTSVIGFVFFNYRIRSLEALERGTPGQDKEGKPLGPAPWDVINDALLAAGFPYEVLSPKDVSITRDYKFKLRDTFSGNVIEVTELSSGEKVIIQLVLWLYSSNKEGVFPKLLLLDEPDAHLHPSMALQFMEVIEEVLVKKHGVRVIMTSHSPSTVALAPDGSIFQLERGAPAVTKVTIRSDIISILTAGLVTVSKSSKFVFVEDEDDVNFYETVREILSNYGPSRDPMAIKPTPSIVFMPASLGTGRKKVSGGATVVPQWIEKFGQEPLRSMFLGVIDRDVDNAVSPSILVIGRYSFENYMLDPLNIFGLLLENNSAPAVHGVNIESGDEHLLRQLSGEFLQKISDTITTMMEAQDVSLASHIRKTVRYTFGQTVEVPEWVIDRRGHNLMPIAQRSFGGANLVNPPRLIRALRRVRLIPIELAELFADMQAH